MPDAVTGVGLDNETRTWWGSKDVTDEDLGRILQFEPADRAHDAHGEVAAAMAPIAHAANAASANRPADRLAVADPVAFQQSVAAPCFAVSDALPLYLLGLIPPPPELGAHLLLATPLEVAVAAAIETAVLQAIAPEPEPQPEPEPLPVIEDLGEAAATGSEPAVPTSTMPEPSTEEPAAPAAAAEVTLTTDAHGEEPPATATATSTEPAREQQNSLLTLDLSRRRAALTVQSLPPPPKPRLVPPEGALWPPPTAAQAADPLPSVLRAVAEGGSDGSRFGKAGIRSIAGGWPGFLTGFVMALAIGVGLYVSLVAG